MIAEWQKLNKRHLSSMNCQEQDLKSHHICVQGDLITHCLIIIIIIIITIIIIINTIITTINIVTITIIIIIIDIIIQRSNYTLKFTLQ